MCLLTSDCELPSHEEWLGDICLSQTSASSSTALCIRMLWTSLLWWVLLQSSRSRQIYFTFLLIRSSSQCSQLRGLDFDHKLFFVYRQSLVALQLSVLCWASCLQCSFLYFYFLFRTIFYPRLNAWASGDSKLWEVLRENLCSLMRTQATERRWKSGITNLTRCLPTISWCSYDNFWPWN